MSFNPDYIPFSERPPDKRAVTSAFANEVTFLIADLQRAADRTKTKAEFADDFKRMGHDKQLGSEALKHEIDNPAMASNRLLGSGMNNHSNTSRQHSNFKSSYLSEYEASKSGSTNIYSVIKEPYGAVNSSPKKPITITSSKDELLPSSSTMRTAFADDPRWAQTMQSAESTSARLEAEKAKRLRMEAEDAEMEKEIAAARANSRNKVVDVDEDSGYESHSSNNILHADQRYADSQDTKIQHSIDRSQSPRNRFTQMSSNRLRTSTNGTRIFDESFPIEPSHPHRQSRELSLDSQIKSAPTKPTPRVMKHSFSVSPSPSLSSNTTPPLNLTVESHHESSDEMNANPQHGLQHLEHSTPASQQQHQTSRLWTNQNNGTLPTTDQSLSFNTPSPLPSITPMRLPSLSRLVTYLHSHRSSLFTERLLRSSKALNVRWDYHWSDLFRRGDIISIAPPNRRRNHGDLSPDTRPSLEESKTGEFFGYSLINTWNQNKNQHQNNQENVRSSSNNLEDKTGPHKLVKLSLSNVNKHNRSVENLVLNSSIDYNEKEKELEYLRGNEVFEGDEIGGELDGGYDDDLNEAHYVVMGVVSVAGGRSGTYDEIVPLDLISKTTKFLNGDEVSWVGGFDDSVPRGEVGFVLGYNERGRVRVKFPKGAWNFLPQELRKESDKGISSEALGLVEKVVCELLGRVLTTAALLAAPNTTTSSDFLQAIQLCIPASSSNSERMLTEALSEFERHKNIANNPSPTSPNATNPSSSSSSSSSSSMLHFDAKDIVNVVDDMRKQFEEVRLMKESSHEEEDNEENDVIANLTISIADASGLSAFLDVLIGHILKQAGRFARSLDDRVGIIRWDHILPTLSSTSLMPLHLTKINLFHQKQQDNIPLLQDGTMNSSNEHVDHMNHQTLQEPNQNFSKNQRDVEQGKVSPNKKGKQQQQTSSVPTTPATEIVTNKELYVAKKLFRKPPPPITLPSKYKNSNNNNAQQHLLVVDGGMNSDGFDPLHEEYQTSDTDMVVDVNANSATSAVPSQNNPNNTTRSAKPTPKLPAYALASKGRKTYLNRQRGSSSVLARASSSRGYSLQQSPPSSPTRLPNPHASAQAFSPPSSSSNGNSASSQQPVYLRRRTLSNEDPYINDNGGGVTAGVGGGSGGGRVTWRDNSGIHSLTIDPSEENEKEFESPNNIRNSKLNESSHQGQITNLTELRIEALRKIETQFEIAKKATTKDYTLLKTLKNLMEEQQSLNEKADLLHAELSLAEQSEDFDKCEMISSTLVLLPVSYEEERRKKEQMEKEEEQEQQLALLAAEEEEMDRMAKLEKLEAQRASMNSAGANKQPLRRNSGNGRPTSPRRNIDTLSKRIISNTSPHRQRLSNSPRRASKSPSRSPSEILTNQNTSSVSPASSNGRQSPLRRSVSPLREFLGGQPSQQHRGDDNPRSPRSLARFMKKPASSFFNSIIEDELNRVDDDEEAGGELRDNEDDEEDDEEEEGELIENELNSEDYDVPSTSGGGTSHRSHSAHVPIDVFNDKIIYEEDEEDLLEEEDDEESEEQQTSNHKQSTNVVNRYKPSFKSTNQKNKNLSNHQKKNVSNKRNSGGNVGAKKPEPIKKPPSYADLLAAASRSFPDWEEETY